MKNRRLMVIRYNTSDALANRLKTCLDMCGIPFVAFREYEFIDGDAAWDFFIDRGKLTWNQVMQEVNRVHSVPFRFVNDGSYIENGNLVCPLN